MTAPSITELLHQLQQGDSSAEAQLLEEVYEPLRKIAQSHLRKERADHTLQPTALVHEVYLRLVGQQRVEWQGRAHFFAVVSTLMRRVLVDHARAREAAKRQSDRRRVTLENVLLPAQESDEVDVLALDEALSRLAELNERHARVVELRFFAGLSVEETAQVLGISPRTVKNDWRTARAWLMTELE